MERLTDIVIDKKIPVKKKLIQFIGTESEVSDEMVAESIHRYDKTRIMYYITSDSFLDTDRWRNLMVQINSYIGNLHPLPLLTLWRIIISEITRISQNVTADY